jgi:hypothetical protein
VVLQRYAIGKGRRDAVMVGLDMGDLPLGQPQANHHRGGKKTQKNSRKNMHARTSQIKSTIKTCYSLAHIRCA